jgi:hypothetical protein
VAGSEAFTIGMAGAKLTLDSETMLYRKHLINDQLARRVNHPEFSGWAERSKSSATRHFSDMPFKYS